MTRDVGRLCLFNLLDFSAFAAGSSAATKLTRFFDKVSLELAGNRFFISFYFGCISFQRKVDVKSDQKKLCGISYII
jgi:hypothetical protein